LLFDQDPPVDINKQNGWCVLTEESVDAIDNIKTQGARPLVTYSPRAWNGSIVDENYLWAWDNLTSIFWPSGGNRSESRLSQYFRWKGNIESPGQSTQGLGLPVSWSPYQEAPPDISTFWQRPRSALITELI